MANYQSLKTAINAVIKANGNKEITGTVLNEVLLAMVNSLGAGYQFAGVATPSTNPGTPDQKVFYIASQAGTYTNFGGAVVSDGIAVFEWDGSWIVETLDLSMAGQVQSDWTETDTTKKSYIKHKPNIPPSANVDPVPTNGSPNAVASGGVYNALKTITDFLNNGYYFVGIAGTSTVPDSVTQYGIFYIASDGGAYTNFLNGDDEPLTLYQGLNILYKDIEDDGWNYFEVFKFSDFVDTTQQQSLSAQQKAQARTNIAAVSYDKQSLNSEQQVQAQNNMMGKAYSSTASDHSGLGKVYLQKNNGVLTQSMINAANTVYVIQYDYTMSGNITVPAGCTLQFDGGCISGSYTITGNGTGIHASLDRIFGDDVTLAGTWNVPEVYPEWFGATGNGVHDDTVAIQKAIDMNLATNIVVKLASKIYIVNPQTPVDWEGVNYGDSQIPAAIIMRSGMSVVGNNSIIKLIDNRSTLLNTCNLFIFFSNEQLHDISFSGITFDINGTNNRISPNSPTSFNRFLFSAIAFSGIFNNKNAKCDGMHIENCKFINNPGVSCITMCQCNSVNVEISNDWIISDCLFKNNGIDTDDHSSIFGWANNVICANNIFTADKPYPNGIGDNGGSFVAYEIHGANHKIISNVIENYYQGLWLASNLSNACNGIVIEGNTFKVTDSAVDTFRNNAGETEISDVTIANNTITLIDGSSVSIKAGIRINTPYKVSDILIQGNICRSLVTNRGDCFVMIGTYNEIANQKTSDIMVLSNTVTGTSVGVLINPSNTNGLGTIKIADNTFKDLAAKGVLPSVGVYMNSYGATTHKAVDMLILDKNMFININSSLYQIGCQLNGSIGDLYCIYQIYKDVIAGLQDNTTASGTKTIVDFGS